MVCKFEACLKRILKKHENMKTNAVNLKDFWKNNFDFCFQFFLVLVFQIWCLQLLFKMFYSITNFLWIYLSAKWCVLFRATTFNKRLILNDVVASTHIHRLPFCIKFRQNVCFVLHFSFFFWKIVRLRASNCLEVMS